MKLGVRKVIIASSETTYGVCFAEGDKDFHSFPLEEDYDIDPMDSYGLSKVCNEKTARAFAMRYGADIYALRIGNVIEPHEYGAVQGLCRQSAGAQAQRLELYRRARPRRDRAAVPGEGRARLPGVQRDQRHDHAQHADRGGAGAALRQRRPSRARWASTRRPCRTARSAKCSASRRRTTGADTRAERQAADEEARSSQDQTTKQRGPRRLWRTGALFRCSRNFWDVADDISADKTLGLRACRQACLISDF